MEELVMRRPNLEGVPPTRDLPPGYTLRTYRDGDLEQLSHVMRGAFADDSWTPGRVRAALLDDPTVKKTFVIEFEGAPVATASARLLPDRYPDAGYLHWVATLPAHQGKGLGRALTIAVLNEFKAMGCAEAALETEDFRLAAIKMYQSLGFEPLHAHETHLERWALVASNLLAAANL